MKSLVVIGIATLLTGPSDAGEKVLSSFAASTEAPHGEGNLYAPEIVKHGGEFLMFFGGQGKDGHDRIHLATSKDGGKWEHQGVVFAVEKANHVNDPSVVVVDGRLYMFYTLAMTGITDSIGLAISKNGRTWQDEGVVLAPSAAPAWDSLLVGRPSVLREGNEFKMWYDARKDLPVGSPDPTAPKATDSRRYVGYATSSDGKIWQRRAEPVYGENAGGIHVSRLGDGYVMLIESGEGVRWAYGPDGLKWETKGLLLPKDDDDAPFGHVTPFLFTEGGRMELCYGAAAARTWDHNSIHRAVLAPGSLAPHPE